MQESLRQTLSFHIVSIATAPALCRHTGTQLLSQRDALSLWVYRCILLYLYNVARFQNNLPFSFFINFARSQGANVAPVKYLYFVDVSRPSRPTVRFGRRLCSQPEIQPAQRFWLLSHRKTRALVATLPTRYATARSSMSRLSKVQSE